MLAIRLQRTGRKGHAQFRMLVQDSRRTPTSGNFVAWLGSYDPHTKALTVDKEKAEFYLKNGAQPSERVARILNKEGVKLPDWVKIDDTRKGSLKNTDKLRKNRPAEEAAPIAETPAEEVADAPVEETQAEETPAEEPVPEAAPAEDEVTQVDEAKKAE
jgi:small subunit ribosomal protein S16